jgi:uncharacterized protein DUF6494
MNEEALNVSMHKFPKAVGITAQRESRSRSAPRLPMAAQRAAGHTGKVLTVGAVGPVVEIELE